MSDVKDFNVHKTEKGRTHQAFTIETEEEGTISFIISNELAYELAHQLQKHVEKAAGFPADSEAARNGRFYSKFYGMQP